MLPKQLVRRRVRCARVRNEALQRLAEEEPVKAELVKLRFFAGLSLRQAAAVLGISSTTGDRYWAYSRAWLFNELRNA